MADGNYQKCSIDPAMEHWDNVSETSHANGNADEVSKKIVEYKKSIKTANDSLNMVKHYASTSLDKKKRLFGFDWGYSYKNRKKEINNYNSENPIDISFSNVENAQEDTVSMKAALEHYESKGETKRMGDSIETCKKDLKKATTDLGNLITAQSKDKSVQGKDVLMKSLLPCWEGGLISLVHNGFVPKSEEKSDWMYYFRGDQKKYVKGWCLYYSGNSDYAKTHKGVDTITPYVSSSVASERHPTEAVGIYSVCDGTVIATSGSSAHSSMGHYVAITANETKLCSTGDGVEGNYLLTLRYLHMKETPLVKVDDDVTVDTLLGYVGNTGSSTAAHIHFDVNTISTPWGDSFNKTNTVNPQQLFDDITFEFGEC